MAISRDAAHVVDDMLPESIFGDDAGLLPGLRRVGYCRPLLSGEERPTCG
jgi:hypothetical protein